MLHRLARWLARKYEYQYHETPGEFDTAAMLGAWKAACTFHQIRPDEDSADALSLCPDGLPVGLYQWGHLKITGAIIDAARDEMRQHGCGRSEASRHETLSLDMPWDNDGERTLGETIEDPRGGHGFDVVADHSVLLALRARRTPKEWDILVRVVADEEPQWHVGLSYGVSESRICQLLGQILAKARVLVAEMEAGTARPPLTAWAREKASERDWLARQGAEAERERLLALHEASVERIRNRNRNRARA